MSDIISIFNYDFMIRAVIAGTLISLCASMLGVPLVLKKYSMIGDGLSHVAFGALSVALVFNVSPLYIAIPVVLIFAFLILKINSESKINADSAIALLSCSALAVGIIVTSVNSGVNIDINSLMFGSVLSIDKSDLILSILISAFVIIIYTMCFNKIYIITFDESFAKSSGINYDFYNMIIALLTALVIVVGMRLMGTLLISGLIIFPAIISIRIFKGFKSVVIFSAIISVFCFISGVVISAMLSIPTGASIVIVNLAVFFISKVFIR